MTMQADRRAIKLGRPRSFLFGTALLALLAGCVTGPVAEATRGHSATEAVGAAPRDVEMPDVFAATERGLWDGRLSLGGIWVAAPDVAAPERVVIRNVETGQEVVGALFRRERFNPGPPLQLSSEAASALGILPGAPTELEVVALRLEEVPEVDAAPLDIAEPNAAADETDLPTIEPADWTASEVGPAENLPVIAPATWTRPSMQTQDGAAADPAGFPMIAAAEWRRAEDV